VTEWTARRILKDLADPERRKRIATAFWRHGDATAKALATVQLAKALRFREESLRRMPIEKMAELLASRAAAPEFEQTIESALMLYHTRDVKDMLAAFLDRWHVPHVNGSIEADDYEVPSADDIQSAVRELPYDKRDVAIYLATAGLLMAGDWQERGWPVVEELAAQLPPPSTP
jgi:hypothetical protein